MQGRSSASLWVTSSRQKRFAFSLVEVLVTLGLLTVISGLSIPVYRQFIVGNELAVATEQIVQGMRYAQSLALSSANSPRGLRIPIGIVFAGVSYAERDSRYDESQYVLPPTVEVSGTTDQEVVYDCEGLPDATKTIIVRTTALGGGSDANTIHVDENGLISVVRGIDLSLQSTRLPLHSIRSGLKPCANAASFTSSRSSSSVRSSDNSASTPPSMLCLPGYLHAGALNNDVFGYQYPGGKDWTDVDRPGGGAYQLAEVGGVLYASSGNVIYKCGNGQWDVYSDTGQPVTFIGNVDGTFMYSNTSNAMASFRGQICRDTGTQVLCGSTVIGTVGTGNSVYSMTVFQDILYIGTGAGAGSQAGIVYSYDGSVWSLASAPKSLTVDAVKSLLVHDSSLYAAGVRTFAGSPEGFVAQYQSGSTWQMVSAQSQLNSQVNILAEHNGQLYAGSTRYDYAACGGGACANPSELGGIVWHYSGGNTWTNILALTRGVTALTSFPKTASLDSCPFAPPPAAAVTVSDADNLITNGPVYAMVQTGSTIYLGGQFTMAGPNTGYGAPVSLTTGLPVSPYGKIAGEVHAAVSDGAGGWYVGGSFTRVAGKLRSNIAHIFADGSLDTGWLPVINGTVYALEKNGSTVFAGGNFTQVNGQSAPYLVALNMSGQSTGTDFGMNGTVRSLLVNGAKLHVGGDFSSSGGQAVAYYTSFNLPLASLPWSARFLTPLLSSVLGVQHALGQSTSISSPVYVVALDRSGRVYVGGDFGILRKTGGSNWNLFLSAAQVGSVRALAFTDSIAFIGADNVGTALPNLFASNLNSGNNVLSSTFTPAPDGAVRTLVLSADLATLFLGGDFRTVAGQTRNRVAALSAVFSSPVLRSFDPSLNGPVNVFAPSSDQTTVFMGGDFTSIGSKERNNLAAFDVTTDTMLSWNPNVDPVLSSGDPSYVLAMVISGKSLFFGGTFEKVGNLPRSNLGSVDILSGSVSTSWQTSADNLVTALATSNGKIFIGGAFTVINGQSRNYLGSVDVVNGSLTGWDPHPDQPINAIVCARCGVFVGGYFTTIGGKNRNYLALLDEQVGVSNLWNPNPDLWVNSLAVYGDDLYVGGFFDYVGSILRSNLASFNLLTGNLNSWNPKVDSMVWAIAPSENSVYVGGDFSKANGVAQKYLAAFDKVNGNLLNWKPEANNRVLALLQFGTQIFAGGDFSGMDTVQNPKPHYIHAPLVTTTDTVSAGSSSNSSTSNSASSVSSSTTSSASSALGGPPSMQLFDDTIYIPSGGKAIFATIRPNDVSYKVLTIKNVGGTDLELISMSIDSQQPFTHVVGPDLVVIPPGGTTTVTYLFEPKGSQGMKQTPFLTFNTNDPAHPQYTFMLEGSSFIPCKDQTALPNMWMNDTEEGAYPLHGGWTTDSGVNLGYWKNDVHYVNNRSVSVPQEFTFCFKNLTPGSTYEVRAVWRAPFGTPPAGNPEFRVYDGPVTGLDHRASGAEFPATVLWQRVDGKVNGFQKGTVDADGVTWQKGIYDNVTVAGTTLIVDMQGDMSAFPDGVWLVPTGTSASSHSAVSSSANSSSVSSSVVSSNSSSSLSSSSSSSPNTSPIGLCQIRADHSSYPLLPYDGSFTLFRSDASDLVTGDTNAQTDIFVKQKQTGVINRVSLRQDGTQIPFSSVHYSTFATGVSDDGRYVAINTNAPGMASPPPLGQGINVNGYIRDTVLGTNINVTGAFSPAPETYGAITDMTPDGRYALYYQTVVSTYVTTYFVYDRVTSTSTKVIFPAGILWSAKLAADGQSIFFSLQSQGGSAIYRYNVASSSATQIYSLGNNAAQFVDTSSDGHFIVFSNSDGTIVYDTVAATVLYQTSILPQAVSISRDGRYTLLVHYPSPGSYDLQAYVYDRQTGLEALASSTTLSAAISSGVSRVALSGNGLTVAFVSKTEDIPPPARRGLNNVYAKDMKSGVLSLVSDQVLSCCVPWTSLPSGGKIIDNSAVGYTEAGDGWKNSGLSNYGTPPRMVDVSAVSSNAVANWCYSGVPPGYYNVRTTWPSYYNGAPQAPYYILPGAGQHGPVVVDQKLVPKKDAIVGPIPFQSLGTFAQTATGDFVVALSAKTLPNGSPTFSAQILADAVWITPVSSVASSSVASSASPTDLIISNVGYKDVTTNSATITWDTNIPADSYVEYGPTTGYENGGTFLPTPLVLHHEVPLSGLTPATLYHFHVRSSSLSPALVRWSGDYVFTTLALSSSCKAGFTSYPLAAGVWEANGPVYAMVRNGTTLYIGGDFTYVAGQVRNGLAAIDVTTGTVLPWNPGSNGIVHTLFLDGSTLYVGGDFTSVAGASRNCLAAVTTSTGSPTSWNPNAGSLVRTLVRAGNRIYAGGDFSFVGSSQKRYPGIAAFDLTDGSVIDWNSPFVHATEAVSVFDLAVHTATTPTLYAVGRFSTSSYVSSAPRSMAIGFQLDANGAYVGVNSWNPSANSVVNTIERTSGNTSIFLGGTFAQVGSQVRNHMAAVQQDIGSPLSWNPSDSSAAGSATVYSMGIRDNEIYIGSGYNPSNGQLLSTYDIHTGIRRSAWKPDIQNGSVRATSFGDNVLYVGGDFATVRGQPHKNLTVVNLCNGSTDIVPPSISNVFVDSITNDSVTIRWRTDEFSDSQVEYGTDTAYGKSTPLDTSLVTEHAVVVSGLSSLTTYQFRVKSRDVNCNLGISSNSSFTMPDTLLPTISDVNAINVSDTAATVTWTTNKPADSYVEYGLAAGSYPSRTTTDVSLVQNHAMSLSGLLPGTLYHYRVRSRDSLSRTVFSGDNTFMTFQISNVKVQNITASSALITWNTSKVSDTQVQYGLTSSYGSFSALNATPVLSHSMKLTGLSANTTYHFRVRSRDPVRWIPDAPGFLGLSPDLAFKTLNEPVPLVISNLVIDQITTTTSVVSWDTNIPADTATDYGLTDAYGFSEPSQPTSFVLHHVVPLTGLSPSTLYKVRVRSSDGVNNASATSSFTTLAINYGERNGFGMNMDGGAIYAFTHIGSTMYVGGNFRVFGSYTGRGVPLSSTTALALSSYPQINGPVHSSVPDGAGGWYIAGQFTRVGGVPRIDLAHITASGDVVSSWNPSIVTSASTAIATSIAYSANRSTVYVAVASSDSLGVFTSKVYALNSLNAAVQWTVSFDDFVQAMAVQDSGSNPALYAGGDFHYVGGVARPGIAALSLADGGVTLWKPIAASVPAGGLSTIVRNAEAIVTTPSGVYMSVQYDTDYGNVSSASISKIARFDSITGAEVWSDPFIGSIRSMVVGTQVLYMGGSFSFVNDQPRKGLASVSLLNGSLSNWRPNN